MNEYNKYLLIDAANMNADIVKARELNPSYILLFTGIFKNVESVSPYIFVFELNSNFSDWYFDNGWGKALGIIIYSKSSIKRLRKQLQFLLKVETTSRKEYYFRFYDPRVFRIFLPTCDLNQFNLFFNQIDFYVCEDENPKNALIFSLEEEELVTKIITEEEAEKFNPVVNKKSFRLF